MSGNLEGYTSDRSDRSDPPLPRPCCPCARYRFAGSVPACEINTLYPFLAAGRDSYFPYAPYSYGRLTPILLSLLIDRQCLRRERRAVGYPWC